MRAVVLATLLVSASLVARAEDAERHFVKGAAHLARSEWAAAEESLSLALEGLPEHPDVLALLGMARYHLGKYRQAADDLTASLRGGTRYRTRVLYYLGLASSMSGEEAKAQRTFTRLLDDHPSSPEADSPRPRPTAGRDSPQWPDRRRLDR